MANRVYETMTKIMVGGYTIRVWRAAADLDAGPEEEIERAFDDVPALTRKQVADVIEKLEGVSAYEILNAYGNGVVCYPNWS